MLRLILEFVPFGDEAKAKIIGTLLIINDGSGRHDSGNYHTSLWEEGAKQEHFPQRIQDFPREKRKAWDLAFVALRRFLAWRNPYVGFPRDEMLYIRRNKSYVQVEPFQGFPQSGVMLVHSGDDDVQRSSYEWIGDIPREDALTHAAARVHGDRACKALTAMKNKKVLESVEVMRRLDGGEPLYRWQEPCIADVVACVLGAIAEGELAEKMKEKQAESQNAEAEIKTP